MDETGPGKDIERRRFLAAAGMATAAVTVSFLPVALRNPATEPTPTARPPRSEVPDPSMPRLFPRALEALDHHGARIVHRDRIAVVDFAQPSRERRMHLIELASGRTESYLVSHGSGSDPARRGWLESFSNVPDSNASSRGAYLTGAAYVGQHGRSRRLVGLDPTNDMAEPRAIVMHGAGYVSDVMADAQGLIGRSQGCFALAEAAIDEVLERLGPGRLLFAWK